MKPNNKSDKLSLIKSLIILDMLQQPSCFINVNKRSKKNSANVKHKNKNPNNLNFKENAKDKINTELILPIKQETFKTDSELILPVYDKINTEKFIFILKVLQLSYYNRVINKTIEDSSTTIDYENNVCRNNLSMIKNSKDKLNSKYILPLQEVIIKGDTECTNKRGKITTNDIYEISENINTDYCDTLISTLPIIIAEKNIDIAIESTFRLKNGALDIKNMKKDVYLTNSKLLPLSEIDAISPSLNGKLFLEGFIRNKLDFSISKGVQNNIINLDTECVIIYIPFKCTTVVHYIVPPVFCKGKSLDDIPIHISSDCSDINEDYKGYLNDKNNKSSEYFSCNIPPINCEIEQIKIYETYTLLDKKPFSKEFPLEMNFHTISENIIINLSLTLLQKQDITINYRKTSKQNPLKR